MNHSPQRTIFSDILLCVIPKAEHKRRTKSHQPRSPIINPHIKLNFSKSTANKSPHQAVNIGLPYRKVPWPAPHRHFLRILNHWLV